IAKYYKNCSAIIKFSQEIFNLDLINKLNEKIKDDTKGVFSNVLNSDMIKSDMIGINTVFFEDEWLYRFSTKLEDFTKFNSTKQKIDFLTLNDAMNIEYNDEANDNLGVFSLKYRGKSGIKQLIFYQKQDIEDWNVFKNSTLSLLKEVLSTEFKFKTATGQSIIKMPKFKTEVSINFRDELNESEGLKHLFDKAADYSNMYKIPLRVSTLFQKAMFENNEKGTKAAAVTVVAMTRMAIIKKPIEKMEFIVNRTFAYALIDSEKNLLFVGVYDGKN
ncbi:MAG: serpin, partial [Paramarteilia canceri]